MGARPPSTVNSGMEGAPSTSDAAQVAPRLWDCLFHGEPFRADSAQRLATRLREVAASLEGGGVVGQQQPQEQQQQEQPAAASSGGKRRRRERGGGADLDFASYRQRYIALELLYLGHAYDGFARQDNTDATIEASGGRGGGGGASARLLKSRRARAQLPRP